MVALGKFETWLLVISVQFTLWIDFGNQSRKVTNWFEQQWIAWVAHQCCTSYQVWFELEWFDCKETMFVWVLWMCKAFTWLMLLRTPVVFGADWNRGISDALGNPGLVFLWFCRFVWAAFLTGWCELILGMQFSLDWTRLVWAGWLGRVFNLLWTVENVKCKILLRHNATILPFVDSNNVSCYNCLRQTSNYCTWKRFQLFVTFNVFDFDNC